MDRPLPGQISCGQTSAEESPYISVWSLSDETLLAGLASGDEAAAAGLVRRFQGRVFGLAYAVLGDKDAAEEVAQETFLRVWKHSAAYDPRRGRVATWILSIARNVAIDMMRLRRYEPFDPEVLVSLQIPSGEAGPDDRGVAADESQRLRGLISTLPEEQRRALVLAAYYGRTAREIGELDGVPVGTVKTRIRAAMLKLRAAYEVRDES